MKIISITDKEINFDNGYILQYYHEQDCCENVYADFPVLRNYNVSTVTGKSIDIREIDFEENLDNLIQGIEGQGFNMVSKIEEKFFVPCYNEQNGYYSSNLKLILKKQQCQENMNIMEFVEDKIY